MFWKMNVEKIAEPLELASSKSEGRFVLHRHRDESGVHLDLRVECGACLRGWRIDGDALVDGCWAVEKAPHPLRWLEEDGDAVREDAGQYFWEHRGADGGTLVLLGERGPVRIRLARQPDVTPGAVREIYAALDAVQADARNAASLIRDGAMARDRAIERLCGLGRELDGRTFEESVWRKTVSGLTLDEIHAQLRAFEVRFDALYPPQPVSRPEALPEMESGSRSEAALSILRS